MKGNLFPIMAYRSTRTLYAASFFLVGVFIALTPDLQGQKVEIIVNGQNVIVEGLDEVDVRVAIEGAKEIQDPIMPIFGLGNGDPSAAQAKPQNGQPQDDLRPVRLELQVPAQWCESSGKRARASGCVVR